MPIGWADPRLGWSPSARARSGLISFADGEGEEAGAPAEKGGGRVDRPFGRGNPERRRKARSGDLTTAVENDGGAVLGSYRDPFGGTPVLLVSLPIDKVEPTPYQRDPSETHVKKLMTVIEKVGRFLDPLVLIRQDDGVLDAERQPSPAGDEEARREEHHRAARARSRSRVQDPRAQHREGAQRQREVARDHPHGARPGGAQGRQGDRLRVRVRAGAVPDARRRLRAEEEPERRRLYIRPPAHRRLPRRADGQGAEGTRAPRQQDPRARRRRRQGR